jgi:hypothetical protein
MSRPVFVCVPGACHSHLIFEPLKSVLSFAGYVVIPLALTSIGGNPPTYDFTEDVQAIRNLVSQLANSGHDIILVMHGYGGLPGGEALLGLGKGERESTGLRGGVVRLVFIMSCKWQSCASHPGNWIVREYCPKRTGILFADGTKTSWADDRGYRPWRSSYSFPTRGCTLDSFFGLRMSLIDERILLIFQLLR